MKQLGEAERLQRAFDQSEEMRDVLLKRMNDLWPLVHAVERAAWSRSYKQVKIARKALEQAIGTRPHFEPFPKITQEP